MKSFNSYPKIHALGHPDTKSIVGKVCRIEEKLDGSQFSFGVNDKGLLFVRSKKATIDPYNPPDLFKVACESVIEAEKHLTPEYTYRAEAFKSHKHNRLTYSRVPLNNFAIFDIATTADSYLNHRDLVNECYVMGFEFVALCEYKLIKSISDVTKFLEKESALGNTKVEGVVLKPIIPIYDYKGKPIYAKVVNDKFKEAQNQKVIRKDTLITDIAKAVCTTARWEKAVQRLKEEERLTGSVEDIKYLVQDLQLDIIEECDDYIKDKLYEGLHKKVLRESVKGFAAWYKAELINNIFEENT